MRQRICSACRLAILVLGLSATPAAAQDRTGPAPAAPQPRWVVEGAAGLHTYYSGNVQSVAFGFRPTRRFTLLVSAERSYVGDKIELYDNGLDAERGATARFISVQLRYSFLSGKRISPYLLAGGGGGVSRLNVSDFFPDSRSHDIAVFYYGGGARMAIGPRLEAVVDARFTLALEGASDYFAVRLPVRAGLAWQF